MLFLFIIPISLLEYKKGKYIFELPPGQYEVNCYGAQGGSAYKDGEFQVNSGGYGAKVSGIMTIANRKRTFYAYVGGQGGSVNDGKSPGGYNGGGKSGEDTQLVGKKETSGGGGGASDLRIDEDLFDNRIIVAAGGSGGAEDCKGAPGGELKGYRSGNGINFIIEEDVNQAQGNENGIGDDGDKSTYTPGSGAGGGWRGGISYSLSTFKIWNSVSSSGSSYISGYAGCTENKAMKFTMGRMEHGVRQGDGFINITTLFECSEGCAACTSGTECTKCFDNYYLTADKKCTTKCAPGFIEGVGKCIPCTHPCETCSESANLCDSCLDGYFLYGSECRKECPESFAALSSEKKCKKCKYGCAICDSAVDNCFACDENYLLHKNECVLSCPDGTIQAGKACEECRPYCKTCAHSADNCTSCVDNYYLLNGKCLSSCPIKTFANGNQCVDCPAPCETCNSEDKCTTCTKDFLLYQDKCVASCPPDTTQYGNTCE